MQKREEILDPNSCLNRALPEEIIFVLLERDDAAPIAIQAWIDARIRLGKNAPDDKQISEAKDTLYKMLKRRS